MFDIADTGPRKDALSPFLWELRYEYLPSVTAALEAEFHVPCDSRGLSVQLATIAARMAGKYWDNGKDIIASFADGCLPDGLDEVFPDAAAASITSHVCHMAIRKRRLLLGTLLLRAAGSKAGSA